MTPAKSILKGGKNDFLLDFRPHHKKDKKLAADQNNPLVKTSLA
jgi:hypothetical protein